MADASGTTTYSYDNRDRLKAKTTPEETEFTGYRSAMRSSSSRADFATRGMAISFFTLTKVARCDSLLSFFSGTGLLSHSSQNNEGQ
jgi:hypothetical protein